MGDALDPRVREYGVKNVYVVTHAQSRHHTDGLVGGWYDSGLTELGRCQAASIGRRIRELLYDQGFTINGARNRLDELVSAPAKPAAAGRAGGVSTSSLRAEIQDVIDLLRA